MAIDGRATWEPTPECGVGESFDEVVLAHLGAARRLARWLLPNEHDAEDVVQEASLRAFRYFRTFTGGNGRAWFLRIVRNTCSGWRSRTLATRMDPFDEALHSAEAPDPEMLLLESDHATLIASALRTLPDPFHQVLVLREIEGLSYRELADVIGIPIGTVMSRLSRARRALRRALTGSKHVRGSARERSREEDAEPVLAG
jgi:RNA polymerase sigma-70 factor (ECF subfamily)